MRDDSQSGPKELSHVVTCYNCQREAKPQTKTFYGTKPNERYTGNLPVKKRCQEKEQTIKFITKLSVILISLL